MQHATAARLAANKKLVLDFHEQIIGRKDFDVAQPLMGGPNPHTVSMT